MATTRRLCLDNCQWNNKKKRASRCSTPEMESLVAMIIKVNLETWRLNPLLLFLVFFGDGVADMLILG